MILAAGLTPAWQHILVFDHLTTGQVNRARTSLWCGSGKVLNVGAALWHLRAECMTLCPVGGATGEQIRADFAQRQIPAHWIDTKAASRVCTTLLDTSSKVTTELVENSTALTAHELAQYVDSFKELVQSARLVVLSGSLPQGTPAEFFRLLMERTNVPTVLDVRGRELLECLPLRPFLVKPNREELAATVGRTLGTDRDLERAMAEVRQMGAEWVVVSNGPNSVLCMGPDGLHVVDPPRVTPVNPIGCGDSLTAAIAARLHAQMAPVDAIRFGVDYAARKAEVLFPVLV